MEGSFYFFLKFLTALQKMPDSVKIQNINIEKNGDTGDILKINMTLMIWYKKREAYENSTVQSFHI